MNKLGDTTCGIVDTACKWNIIPGKCCDSIKKGYCKQKYEDEDEDDE